MSKQLNKLITRQFAFEVVRKDESGEHEFVISTEAVDSYGTVFKIDGWDLASYNRNPIFCYQHKSFSSDPDDILGTSEVRIEDGKLIAKPRYDDAESNPKADKIRRKVEAGTLRMASVGARVLDGRWGDKNLAEDPDVFYFTKVELREWSIVSVGSNPDAVKRNEDVMDELKGGKPEPKQEKRSELSINKARLMLNKNRS